MTTIDNVWGLEFNEDQPHSPVWRASETRPTELTTDDPISTASGYIGGLQTITGLAVDPAGNV